MADAPGKLDNAGFFDVDSEAEDSGEDYIDYEQAEDAGTEVSDSDASDVVDWNSLYTDALSSRKRGQGQRRERKDSLTKQGITSRTRGLTVATGGRSRKKKVKFMESGIGLPVDRGNARMYRNHAHIAKNHAYLLGHIALGMPPPQRKHEREKARSAKRVCTPQELAQHSSITDAFAPPLGSADADDNAASGASGAGGAGGGAGAAGSKYTPDSAEQQQHHHQAPRRLDERQLAPSVPQNSYFHRVLAQENSAYSE